MRKYVLDSSCYIDASHDAETLRALVHFVSWSAPGLYLSSVVAAELRAGVSTGAARRQLEEQVLDPFVRRGRVLTPSAAAWDALGLTLATLREKEGIRLKDVRRSFAHDVLLAYSCRERGAVLITSNERDMKRIRSVFSFEHAPPFPARI